MKLFDKIQNLKINCQTVSLEDITIDDKELYYKLYTDEDLNKYWGYDYKTDAPKNPTIDYFFDFCELLKLAKEEYSYAIKLKGEMIGEFVLHGFEENGFEIGFRIFKEHHGNGYVKDVIKSFINYAKTHVKPNFIKAKCFKQNLASYNLLTKCGFNNYTNDEFYNYFIYNLKAD